MTTFEWWSVCLGFGALIVAGFGVWVARGQLTRMADAATSSTWTFILSLEEAIHSRNSARADAATEVIQLANKRTAGEHVTDAEMKIAEQWLKIRTQEYLNVLDRLATCFRRGFIPEAGFKSDYRELINDAVKTHAADFGGVEEKYHNLLWLRDKWRDD